MGDTFLKQATLLYVEDDEVIRTFLAKRLEPRVSKLYLATDGQDGLEKFKQFKPDVVLTDVTMPLMNGIEMAEKIKKIDESIPIIIASAHNDSKFLLDAIALGIDGYLLKPIDKKKLFDTLEKKVKTNFIEKELAKKKQQLLHQSRFALLGEMVSMIAHQWRQPLNLIALTMASIRMKFMSNKFDLSTEAGIALLTQKVETDLTKVEDRVSVLSSIIDDFATFYKPNDETEIFHINHTVAQTIQNFKSSLQVDHININETYNSNKNIKIYKDVFMQICINLLNNSQENFTQKEIKNPEIIVETRDCDEGVEIILSDNAGGIPDDIIDKIFDPYFSTKVGKNGNGLGLYMSKLVIEEHLNGVISVSNVNDGVQFIIKLKE